MLISRPDVFELFVLSATLAVALLCAPCVGETQDGKNCESNPEHYVEELCGPAYRRMSAATGASEDVIKSHIVDIMLGRRELDSSDWCPRNHSTSFDRVLAFIAPGIYGNSSDCRWDSLAYFCQLFLDNMEPWVLGMFDAGGKIPDGILLGNVYTLGNFDQCIKLEGKSSCGTAPFKGRYCMAQFKFTCNSTLDECLKDKFPNNTGDEVDQSDILLGIFDKLMRMNLVNCINEKKGIRLPLSRGICVPSSCTYKDIKCGMEAPMLGHGKPWKTDMAEESCHSVEDNSRRSAEDYIILCVFLVISAFMIIGTSYELHKFVAERDKADPTIGLRQLAEDGDIRNNEYIAIKISGLEQFFEAFSLSSNWTKLFESPHVDANNQSRILCIHGMRVFTTMWIILARTYEFILYLPWINEADLGQTLQRWTFEVIANATVATDTFFLIGGTLLSYNLLIKFRNSLNAKLRQDFVLVAKLFVRRYFRLMTPLLMCIAFAATTFHKIGSGPFWKAMIDENVTGRCRRNWWTNLLFINNYVETDAPCLGHTWFGACDLQFFLIGAVLIIPLSYTEERKFGYVPLCFATLLSMVVPGLVTGLKKYPPTLIIDHMMQNIEGGYVKDFFIVSHTRFGPYVVGIWLGYHLFQTKDRYDSIPMRYWATGWILSMIVGISVLYGMHDVNKLNSPPYSETTAIIYAGLHRTAWALAVAWVIFACQKGYAGSLSTIFSLSISGPRYRACLFPRRKLFLLPPAGLINSLLAWKGWVPYSRLTYCVYLSSYFVQLWYYVSRKVAFHFDHDFMVSMFFGQIMGSYLVGIVLYMSVEAPTANLIRLGTEYWSKRKSKLMMSAAETAEDGENGRDISVISARANRLKGRRSHPSNAQKQARRNPQSSFPKVIQRRSSVYFRKNTPTSDPEYATTPSMSRAESTFDISNIGAQGPHEES